MVVNVTTWCNGGCSGKLSRIEVGDGELTEAPVVYNVEEEVCPAAECTCVPSVDGGVCLDRVTSHCSNV